MSDSIVMATDARLAALTTKRTNYLLTLTLRLYKNNHVPVVTDVLANYTIADFPGYGSQSLNDFGAVFLNADNEAESDTGVHTFVCTGVPAGGSQDIYGWYTVDGAGKLGPAARFTAAVPITLTGSGQSISVQIFFEDGGLLEE